jgi:adenylosuccinate synthase
MSSEQERFIHNLAALKAWVVAVVDYVFGDNGKGKLVDYFTALADINARGTGGSNAGHTMVVDDNVYIVHLVPAGILWDRAGTLNVIGRGVAVDPRTLAHEIAELRGVGIHCNGLRVSRNAHLVLPFDVALDRLKEARNGTSAIGTTGRGIGPVYESWVARTGLFANDLLNKDVFAASLKRNLEARIALFKQFDPMLVKEVLTSDALEHGAFYGGPEKIFDTDAIVEQYLRHASSFESLIVDTDALMRQAVGKKRIVLEGAQGVLLSVSHGTYPYVTSSDCSIAGLTEGVGLRTEHVDYELGVVKGPFMTRVGNGAFPTEHGGERSAKWCASVAVTKEVERDRYPDVSINSVDSFEQGVAIRQAGNEYGATTGRLRRVGWLDLPLLRYAVQHGSSNIALTKVDILNECKVIKLCVQYRYEGDDYRVGDKLLKRGDALDVAVMDAYVMAHCVPMYVDLPGWCCDLSGIRSVESLPPKLLAVVREIERRAGVRVDVLSVGADREDTIIL